MKIYPIIFTLAFFCVYVHSIPVDIISASDLPWVPAGVPIIGVEAPKACPCRSTPMSDVVSIVGVDAPKASDGM